MTLVSQGEAIAINREMASDREKAEHYLLAYAEELKKYQDGRREYVSSGRSKKNKSPVEHAVLRGAAYDAQSDALHWLQAVEIVERGMDGRKLLFLTARRKAEARKGTGFGCGRPGWVAVTQMIFAEAMEKQYLAPGYWLAERTVKSWWRDIISRTVNVALKIKNNFGQHFIPPKTW